jgi:cellulose synthase/poly-beta-1,6-N-acetylglucosamine synthase-like glycosyltransferase
MRRDIHNWFKITLFVFVPMAVLCYFYLDRVKLLHLFSLYGVLSVSRIVFQSVAAAIVRRKKYRPKGAGMASIIVAAFNEDPEVFRASIESLKAQDYPSLEIIVIDDGSDNARALKAICRELEIGYLYQQNAGKREAMYRAFAHLSPLSQYVLTADSDTVWAPSAARELVATLQSDARMGAVTGFVDTLNPSDNFLTRLLSLRYYMAFQHERAAQSLFGAVTCVSGPLGGYKRHLVEAIKDDFISQTFLGKRCTFGDDRHLTNLVLRKGYQVKYSNAVCYTAVPRGFGEYLKQQQRWGKSHWREMLWQFGALPKHSLYLAYDWVTTLLLPMLLVASLVYYGWAAVAHGAWYLAYVFLMILVMSLLRTILPLVETRRAVFLLFPVYSVMHLFVLLPLKFVSLATVLHGTWGTRQKGVVAAEVAR